LHLRNTKTAWAALGPYPVAPFAPPSLGRAERDQRKGLIFVFRNPRFSPHPSPACAGAGERGGTRNRGGSQAQVHSFQNFEQGGAQAQHIATALQQQFSGAVKQRIFIWGPMGAYSSGGLQRVLRYALRYKSIPLSGKTPQLRQPVHVHPDTRDRRLGNYAAGRAHM